MERPIKVQLPGSQSFMTWIIAETLDRPLPRKRCAFSARQASIRTSRPARTGSFPGRGALTFGGDEARTMTLLHARQAMHVIGEKQDGPGRVHRFKRLCQKN